jgi:hypothetical protein
LGRLDLSGLGGSVDVVGIFLGRQTKAVATDLGRAVMRPFAAGTTATDTDLELLLRQ